MHVHSDTNVHMFGTIESNSWGGVAGTNTHGVYVKYETTAGLYNGILVQSAKFGFKVTKTWKMGIFLLMKKKLKKLEIHCYTSFPRIWIDKLVCIYLRISKHFKVQGTSKLVFSHGLKLINI